MENIRHNVYTLTATYYIIVKETGAMIPSNTLTH